MRLDPNTMKIAHPFYEDDERPMCYEIRQGIVNDDEFALRFEGGTIGWYDSLAATIEAMLLDVAATAITDSGE